MSAISELSSAVRHRLRTSDFDLEKIRDAVDGMKEAMVGIAAQNTRMQAFLEGQRAVGEVVVVVVVVMWWGDDMWCGGDVVVVVWLWC